MSGTLYLVPNLLGAVPPEQVLPARTLEVARRLSHWIVETAKPARAFLRTLELPRPIAACWMREIGQAPDAARIAELLGPAREGHAEAGEELAPVTRRGREQQRRVRHCFIEGF